MLLPIKPSFAACLYGLRANGIIKIKRR